MTMKKLLNIILATVIVAIMLSAIGCTDNTNDSPTPKPEETAPLIYETQRATVTFEVLEGVAIDRADTYFAVSPVGGNPDFFKSQNDGLSFYAYEKLSQTYYKGTIFLPDGYTSGNIVTGIRGAGSGEVSLVVLTKKDGEECYIQYDLIGWYPDCKPYFDAYLYFPDSSTAGGKLYIENIESLIKKQNSITREN